MVAKERDFFERAFGKNVEEFNKILSLPRDFLLYRQYFETVGLTSKWEAEYNNLKRKGKLKELLTLLSSDARTSENKDLDRILQYYKITYKSLKKKEKNNYLAIS
ncbi:hypothetical protein JYT98_01005 [bacterium AH-315-K05]|nr:hypothetical protein [bacterium AH-315-K05]MBN4062794.1 hypothetical protein [Alkaliphilus sp. AH-315-G20]MBN4069986.1 hypothetical protein [bacterium AH-315-G05]MBN4074643.1 hypothetical protein [bacterium AH-315-E09]